MSATFAISVAITALVALPKNWGYSILLTAWVVCGIATTGWIISNYKNPRRLAISYDAKKPGCVWTEEFHYEGGTTEPCKIARLFCESKRKLDIIGCKAVLTSIERDGKQIISGNNFKMHFCPASDPDSVAKTIRYGNAEYLEVLKINQDNGKVDIMADFSFATEQYKRLDEQASYLLHLKFSGDEIKPRAATLAVDTKDGTWKLSIKRLS